MIPNFQIIHFHFTIPLVNLSFLEVHTTAALQDQEKATSMFTAAYKKEVKNQLKTLEDTLKIPGQLMVYFSKSFLDLLSIEDPYQLESIAELVYNKRIILVGSCAYGSFSYLCHPTLFQEEVKLHQKALKEYFKQKADYFINTACLYDNQLANLLEKFNYHTVIATANNWHLGGKQASQLFVSTGEAPIQIILANGDGTATQSISLVNGYGSGYNNEPFEAIAVEEIVLLEQKNSVESNIYSVSLPISSPEWQYSIPQYTANPLQKAFLLEGNRLMEAKGAVLNQDDLTTFMCLFQPEQLLQMNQSSQASSYQHFIQAMNILTTIGLRNK